MTIETHIRRGRHCTFLMHAHLVFVAKYRRKIFDLDAIEKLRGYFASVCANFDVELVEMDGKSDHVHLLINYPPKRTVKAFCGLRATLLEVVAAHQYPSSGSTLNNSKHLIRWKTAPYIPALKDGVLRRIE